MIGLTVEKIKNFRALHNGHYEIGEHEWVEHYKIVKFLLSQLATITEQNKDLKLQRDKLMLVCEEETGAIKALTADLDTSEAACADLMTLNDKLTGEIKEEVDNARILLSQALKGICFTRDYVGEEMLPAIEGWSWYDAGMSIVLHIPADKWAHEFMNRVRKYEALKATK